MCHPFDTDGYVRVVSPIVKPILSRRYYCLASVATLAYNGRNTSLGYAYSTAGFRLLSNSWSHQLLIRICIWYTYLKALHIHNISSEALRSLLYLVRYHFSSRNIAWLSAFPRNWPREHKYFICKLQVILILFDISLASWLKLIILKL